MNQMQLGDFAPPLNPKLSQYHTPVKLARRIVEWCGDVSHMSMRILEPSAGGGNIVRELVRSGAVAVDAVEIDPAWVRVLKKEFPPQCVEVVMSDFFAALLPGDYSLAVMNPPLTGGVGAHHIKRALDYAPRVVSILRGQDLHCKERYRELWSKCHLAGIAFLVERPVYCGDGGVIETVVVDVRRVGTFHGEQRIEHWEDRWAS